MNSVDLIKILAIALVPSVVAANEPQRTNEAQRIVDRALQVVRTGGAEWIAENDCLSCHRVGVQVWALNRAAENGFDTDSGQLDAWNAWATTWQNMVNPKRRGKKTMKETLAGESDTVVQLLLGRPASEQDARWITTYRDHLLLGQQDGGSWLPAGQLPIQKRPKRETEEVSTMWALLGLQAGGLPEAEFTKADRKARDWMGNQTQGKSTEWWAVRLLLERSAGNPDRARELRAKLLSFQRDDGGWGWLTQEKSDALGTGIALYALARDGLSSQATSVRRAVSFLNAGQQEDGAWSVRGTKQAYRDEVTETASYWGACWTVIGLLEFERQDANRARGN